MTPTDKFVEAMSKFGDIYPSHDDPYFDREMIETWTRQAVEAFADAECESADYAACAQRAAQGYMDIEIWPDELEEAEHIKCRAALLKRVME